MPASVLKSAQTNELITSSPGFMLVDLGSNFIELTITADTFFDDRMVLAIRGALTTYRPKTKFFVLAQSSGFFRISKKARKMGASRQYSSHLNAVAFHTRNYSLVLLGELYNKLNKPAVPTKLFQNREEAWHWLLEMRHQQNKTTI